MAQIPTSSITMAQIIAEVGLSGSQTLDACRAASTSYVLPSSPSIPGHTRDGNEQTNTNASPHYNTMAEWAGYQHALSMGTIVYNVRLSNSASQWGLTQSSNDDATGGDNAEADGGIVLFRTHTATHTYVKAKRVVLGSLQGSRTDSGNHYDTSSASLTDSASGVVIITIPVGSNHVTGGVTITASSPYAMSGTNVSKAAGSITGTGALLIIARGAEDAEAEAGPFGSGGSSQEFECDFKIILTATATGYQTTVLDSGVSGNGIVINAHNSATADEEDEEDDCPDCCIHEDMLISTGEDMKSIHDIEIGDSVVSHNFETGENELVEVEDKIVVERDVDYKINDLILTEDHPIYLDTGRKASIDPQATLRNYKQEVDEVKVGDVMQRVDGTTEEITSIERYEGTHVNYTLKTKHNNFYANNILVSWVDSR